MQLQQIMKRLFTFLSAALFTGAMALPALTQDYQMPPPPAGFGYGHPGPSYRGNYPGSHRYAADFNHFFDAHPEMARQLSADPRLIDNPGYLRAHPELGQYMWAHPGVDEAFREHPYNFVHEEHAMNHWRWDREHHRWCR
jgi:hypothetical protein